MQRWSQGQHLWLAQAQSQHLTRFLVSENVEWKLWRQFRIIMNWCAAGSGIGCKDKISSRLKSISMHVCIWHLILQFYTLLFCPTNISDLPLPNRDGCCALKARNEATKSLWVGWTKKGTEEMMLHLKGCMLTRSALPYKIPTCPSQNKSSHNINTTINKKPEQPMSPTAN